MAESQNNSYIDTSISSSEYLFSSTSNLHEDLKKTRLNLACHNYGESKATLEVIKSDLEFVFPLMIEFPKCYWIWKYRLWLLEEANKRLETHVAEGLWKRELVLVGKMLAKDNRNFHGWGYRRRAIAELESSRLNGGSMVESEFDYTTKMIRASLSNFSAWHNRSKLVPRLLDERKASNEKRRQFLDDGENLSHVYRTILLTNS